MRMNKFKKKLKKYKNYSSEIIKRDEGRCYSLFPACQHKKLLRVDVCVYLHYLCGKKE